MKVLKARVLVGNSSRSRLAVFCNALHCFTEVCERDRQEMSRLPHEGAEER